MAVPQPQGALLNTGTPALPMAYPQLTPPSYNQVLTQMNQAHDDTNAANEARYQEILGGYRQNEQAYASREQSLLGLMQNYGGADRANFGRVAEQKQAALTQKQVSRGMYSTTAAMGQNRQLDYETNQARAQLEQGIRQGQISYAAALSGDTLQQRGKTLGFMESKNETGPGMADVAGLAQVWGQGQATNPYTGTLPGVQPTPQQAGGTANTRTVGTTRTQGVTGGVGAGSAYPTVGVAVTSGKSNMPGPSTFSGGGGGGATSPMNHTDWVQLIEERNRKWREEQAQRDAESRTKQNQTNTNTNPSGKTVVVNGKPVNTTNSGMEPYFSGSGAMIGTISSAIVDACVDPKTGNMNYGLLAQMWDKYGVKGGKLAPAPKPDVAANVKTGPMSDQMNAIGSIA